MQEAFSFFQAFRVWIFVLLGLVGLIYVRKFILGWQELRDASFGLERDNAQARLNQAATVLALIFTMVVLEVVLVYVIAPDFLVAAVQPTPTLSLLMTSTATFSPQSTTTPGGPPTAVFLPTAPVVSGCLPGQIELISPLNGQTLSGVVEVRGTADLPNFGFYKFEMKLPDQPNWLTIQAGNVPVQSGKLGDWDTRRLSPGEYQLGLVVVDNQARLSPPCIVQVRVIPAPEITSNP